MARSDRCPKCGGKDLVIVVRLPWSTDGFTTPKRNVYLKCDDCSYTIDISEDV